MKLPLSYLPLLGFCLLMVSTAAGKGKGKHPGNNQPPAPTEAPAPSVSLDAWPSASLQPFLEAHLAHVVAPLDGAGLQRPEVLTEYRSTLADTLAKTTPPRRPAYQAAIAVCDAMANAAAERQTALNALQGVKASTNSGTLGVTSHPGYLSYEQLHSEYNAKQGAKQTDNALANTQKTQWNQRAAALRQNIEQAYAREREIERQAIATALAAEVAESRHEATQRYPQLGVEGSPFNAAFTARYNRYQTQQPSYFQDGAWPLRLADEVAREQAPASPAPVPGGSPTPSK